MDLLIIDMGTTIKGETTIDTYKDKIEVLSFSHGVAQPVTGDQSQQKRTSGRPHHQDFTFTKFLDLASASIIDFCDQAKIVASVKFYVLQTEGGKTNAIWTITLTNVIISSYSVGGGGGGKPTETVTLNYEKIQWDYKQQTIAAGDSGTASAKWSLASNKAE